MNYIPLSNDEYPAARAAVLDAFRDKPTLKRAVRNTGERLDQIAGGDNLTTLVDSLLDWFDEKARIPELLRALRQENSTNERLRTFEVTYLQARVSVAVAEPGEELLALMMAVPALQNEVERNKLIAGVPGAEQVPRNRHDHRADLVAIADWLVGDEVARRAVLARVAVDTSDYNPTLSARFAQLAGTTVRKVVTNVFGGRFSGKRLEQLAFEGEDARLPRIFVEAALSCGASVARLKVPRFGGAGSAASWGTGWLVAPRLLVTCDHVVVARDLEWEPRPPDEVIRKQATATVARFDYYDTNSAYSEVGVESLLAWDAGLDVALLRLASEPATSTRSPLRLRRERPTLTSRDRLNIIQHASGEPQQYAFRNNFFQRRSEDERVFWYLTDTMPGASGSPVFNDRWEVVALHHAARPAPTGVTSIDAPTHKIARFWNEGVDIISITAWLKEKHTVLWDELAIAQGW